MDNCLTAKLIGSELPTTMKAGDLTGTKKKNLSMMVNPKLLQEVEVPVPSPKAGQVLVQVAGSAFNPVDWKLLESPLSLTWSIPHSCFGVDW